MEICISFEKVHKEVDVCHIMSERGKSRLHRGGYDPGNVNAHLDWLLNEIMMY